MYAVQHFKVHYLKGTSDVILRTCILKYNNLFITLWFLIGTDAAILLWKLNDSKEPEQAPMFQEDEDAQLNKESWSVVKTLRYTTLVRIIVALKTIFTSFPLILKTL